MINVFCNKRGSGKTKALIQLANEKVHEAKGHLVYIDDDRRPMYDLDRRIRFISTEDFELKDYHGFYGFLCGILSENYDVDTIFIDGLNNIVSCSLEDMAHLFFKLEKITKEHSVNLYVNMNCDSVGEEIPDFIKKYLCAA